MSDNYYLWQQALIGRDAVLIQLFLSALAIVAAWHIYRVQVDRWPWSSLIQRLALLGGLLLWGWTLVYLAGAS